MIYLRSISRRQEQTDLNYFPFSLPAIDSLKKLEFTSSVTLFVGENGSGKSTLLEGIAAGFGSISIGSQDIEHDPSMAVARTLGKQLKFVKNRHPKRGFFLRAEDFFGFTKRIENAGHELDELEQEYAVSLSGYGRDLAMGMAQGQKRALDDKYGKEPDAFSHGENLLNILNTRLVPGGLYLFDEPETPLSAIRQLTLISILKDMVEKDCQFIIATHSPILMAFPEALIMSFDEDHISQIEFDEIENVTVTKAFLNDPESFLRRL